MPQVSTAPPVGIHGVLSVLADTAEPRTSTRRGLPERLHWLPLCNAEHMPRWGSSFSPVRVDDGDIVTEMAAIDAIRPGEETLKVGWLWVAGTTTDADGNSARTFEPLITTTVRVAGSQVIGSGELLLTPLIADPTTRLQLEEAMEREGVAFGGGAFARTGRVASEDLLRRTAQLGSFARRAAAAAGFDAVDLVPAGAGPAALAARPGLRIVVGMGLYADEAEPDFSPAGSLRMWERRIDTRWTALHSLYLDRPPPAPPACRDLPSPYPLTPTQHDCVVAARSAAVTVIAGAPGTGKTHSIAAIVGDVVAQGQTVLVTAKSIASVAALTEILERRPGPEPVVFGSGARRLELARQLAASRPESVPANEVDRRACQLEAALQRRDDVWASTARRLAGLGLMGDSGELTRLHERLPGLSDPDVSLFEIQALATKAGGRPPPWYRVGRRRHWRHLCDLLGVATDPRGEDLRAVLSLASATRVLHRFGHPTEDGLEWDSLAAAVTRVRQACGEWMNALAHDERRLTRRTRGTLAALGTALRGGRAKRRAHLSRLGPAMTQALPVWVGTLGDVDDLLPMHPAMFDLVVLDEASSIDQSRAAPALLRGRRCVIAGDPRQLRHVSFVPDDAVSDALDRHMPGADPALRARLDVRANSIFDVAAGTTAVRHLDEHFRSAPHLFDFVGRRLYGDRVRLATVTPRAEDDDLIRVSRLAAHRTSAKVIVEEVEWVMDRLDALGVDGVDSVGVVSPFRAQADALEEAALRHFGREGIEALGLKIGTVHAFQGMERDVVLVSLGIGAEDGPMTWRFAQDPHLFAVMATRARKRIEWVVSADPDPGSLLADYLAQADTSVGGPSGMTHHPADPWRDTVAESLCEAGVSLMAPYPVGRHLLDLCLVNADGFIGVDTTVHPDGPDAHIRRHLDLQRQGWPLASAFAAVWRDRPAELVVHLKQRLEETR